MYLFIVGDKIKGCHHDLETVKKWCLEHEIITKENCFIAKEVDR